MHLSSNPQVRFKEKLKHVKDALKLWNKDIRSSSSRNKLEISKKISDIDLLIDSGANYHLLAASRTCALKDLALIENIEAADLAQKNKRLISGLGDENYAFFHTNLKRKRKKLQIAGIMSNGLWITQPSLVKEAFFRFFKDNLLLLIMFALSTQVDTLNHSLVKVLISLSLPFSKLKSRMQFGLVGAIKLPAPVVSSLIPRGCNSSFFSLIPKKDNPIHIQDYRPISLIGVQYKIITKLLAFRLSLVIDEVISPEQTAYIKGRQILDGPLIINEVISWCKRRNKKNDDFQGGL
ncbi:uncharacterized protein [Rutidosis leptorrhynchoides]|uniref:uncharacterized protein n=1 Tax=Rutidosis leptorrhynchoides TaxID=125765 RepID=UPI003A99349A